MRVGAVILAAGASTRMGRPKARIEWQGRPFLLHCIGRGRNAGCAATVVVDGAADLKDLVPTGVIRVHNPDWQAGPLSSLQRGLTSLFASNPDVRGVLVQTVDRPHIRTETIRALLRVFDAEPRLVWQPRFGERRGHPILYPRDLAEALLELPQTASARDLLGAPVAASRRATVFVDDPAVNDNIDTPEALRVLERA